MAFWDNDPVVKTPAPPANFWAGDPVSVSPTPSPTPAASESVDTGDWRTEATETELPGGKKSRVTSPSDLAMLLSNGQHGTGVAARNTIEAVGAIPSLLATGVRSLVGMLPPEALGGGRPPERNLESIIKEEPAPVSPAVAPINLGGGLADLIGLPEPEGNFENQVSALQQGATGAVLPLGAGKFLESAAPKVASFLTAKPALQVAAGATGADAAELTKEAGGGPGSQLAASLAGGLIPSLPGAAVNGLKSIVQGGSKGAATIAENLKNFEGAGATPTVGQVTGQGNLQALEGGVLGNSPGSGGIIHKAAVKQQGDIGKRVDEIASTLDPKASDQMGVGRAIKTGVEDSFVPSAKDTQQRLYSALDMHIDPLGEVPATNTVNLLRSETTPIPGAEALSESSLLSNPTLKEAAGAMKKDMAGTPPTASPIIDPATGKPFITPGTPPKGTLPYDAIKQVRTKVGSMLSDFDLVSPVPRAKLKQLYGALSSDMESAAKAAGPEAYKAFQRANRYTKSMHSRMEVLQSVVDRNGGPENIYNAALAGNRDGATTIRAVMQSLPPESQKTLASSILRRMGRATDGNQNADSSIFSTETFLSNVSKMSDAAKRAVFDRFGPGFHDDMEKVLKVAENLRFGSKIYKNPSGTVQGISNRNTAGAFAFSLITGNAAGTFGIPAIVGAANLAARAFTSPKIVKWLASAANKPKEALPALVNQLALQNKQDNDPDIAQFTDYLKDQIANPKNNEK